MNRNTFLKARKFIYRNARPLDLARWQYHFEGGTTEAVLNALLTYQNEDGGFGHGLEPDSWNPNSTPLQTWSATEIIHETMYSEKNSRIVRDILAFLDSGKHFNGYTWLNTIMTNNDYPHAPWWGVDSESTSHTDYNPSAALAGFIIKYSEKDSSIYNKAIKIAKRSIDDYLLKDQLTDMHTGSNFVRLIECCDEEGLSKELKLKEAKDSISKFVSKTITADTSTWATEYICKPSFFIKNRDSMFYENNKEAAEYECEFIAETQLEDGSWNITWSWNDYPEEWSISKNWWKAEGIIGNIQYLKSFGKLDKVLG